MGRRLGKTKHEPDTLALVRRRPARPEDRVRARCRPEAATSSDRTSAFGAANDEPVASRAPPARRAVIPEREKQNGESPEVALSAVF